MEKDYEEVFIKDILPEGMEYVRVARNNETQEVNYDGVLRTVKISLANDGTKLKQELPALFGLM